MITGNDEFINAHQHTHSTNVALLLTTMHTNTPINTHSRNMPIIMASLVTVVSFYVNVNPGV